MNGISLTDMTYAQLKAFHAVAMTGGFSRAAARLALTQPAVSDHVRKLEEGYGVQLFVRNSRGVTLSELGRKLLAITERQFEAESQAHELLSRARTLEEGQITIGADAAVHVLGQVARFKARFPRIAVKLVSGNSAELITKLIDFSIDFAVTADKPASDTIASRKLREDELVVVAAADSPLARKARISFAELASAPLILREQGSATRRLLMDEMARRNLKPLEVTEIEGRESAREAAAQGLGLAVMSMGEMTQDSRLRLLRITDWNPRMEEWLMWLGARADLHLIRSFLDIAK
jgi:aminoethylphosphonate catabolism LysR family transcriptional regulator